jgi:hypothetical protein
MRRSESLFWPYDWYIVATPLFLAQAVLRLFALVEDVCYNTRTFSSHIKKAPDDADSSEANCHADAGGWHNLVYHVRLP